MGWKREKGGKCGALSAAWQIGMTFAGDDIDKDKGRHSRGAFRPSFAGFLSPSEMRGRRECRVMASPMARLQQKTQAAVTTGLAGSTGGLKRSSQHLVFSLMPAIRQAPPLGFSIPASFSVGH